MVTIYIFFFVVKYSYNTLMKWFERKEKRLTKGKLGKEWLGDDCKKSKSYEIKHEVCSGSVGENKTQKPSGPRQLLFLAPLCSQFKISRRKIWLAPLKVMGQWSVNELATFGSGPRWGRYQGQMQDHEACWAAYFKGYRYRYLETCLLYLPDVWSLLDFMKLLNSHDYTVFQKTEQLNVSDGKNVGNPYLTCLKKLNFNCFFSYTKFYSLSSKCNFMPKYMQPVFIPLVPSLIHGPDKIWSLFSLWRLCGKNFYSALPHMTSLFHIEPLAPSFSNYLPIITDSNFSLLEVKFSQGLKERFDES